MDNLQQREAKKEGDAVYRVELVAHCIIRVLSAKSDFEFRHILFRIGEIKGSNQ